MCPCVIAGAAASQWSVFDVNTAAVSSLIISLVSSAHDASTPHSISRSSILCTSRLSARSVESHPSGHYVGVLVREITVFSPTACPVAPSYDPHPHQHSHTRSPSDATYAANAKRVNLCNECKKTQLAQRLKCSDVKRSSLQFWWSIFWTSVSMAAKEMIKFC